MKTQAEVSRVMWIDGQSLVEYKLSNYEEAQGILENCEDWEL